MLLCREALGENLFPAHLGCWRNSVPCGYKTIHLYFLHYIAGYAVREGEVQNKNETGTLQEQITFNEARRGNSQISALLPLPKKRVSIYRHVCGKLLS